MNKLIYIFWVVLMGVGTIHAQEQNNIKVNAPGYFEINIRSLFKAEKWEEGKRMLDDGLKSYPYLTTLNELAGRYYYHLKEYDIARYHLILALRDDRDNVQAKQILVNVEEDTGNYSSALCYVNELLEVTPYGKELWRRKIALYRRQNNHIEADRLLRRILQVYPNDSILRIDLEYRLDQDYREKQKNGNSNAAIKDLEELINNGNGTEEYYLALINLYIQRSDYDAALRIASLGEIAIPKSEEIAFKKASILAENQEYAKAITYVKGKKEKGLGNKIASLYTDFMLEEARSENDKEPYVLHGKLYEITKNKESLDYLINTAVLRGYNEDALRYIQIAKKREKPTASLLYKEYQVNVRMGNVNKSAQLLEDILKINPADLAIIDELSAIKLKQAASYMVDDNMYEAIRTLNYVVDNCSDKEIKTAAYEKLYTCYVQKKQYSEALKVLDMLSLGSSSTSLLERKVSIYAKQERTIEGLKLIEDSLAVTNVESSRVRLIAAYEEVAIPYIKSLVEEGALYDALSAANNLLKIKPSSLEALQYTVNISYTLGAYDDFEKYVALALTHYPTNAFFVVKQSTILNDKKESQRAIDLLTPTIKRLPGSAMVVNAFTESTEKQAYLLLKEKRVNEALTITNEALQYDKNNKSLLYTKGIIYAALNKFDSAYYYQKAYSPTFIEAPKFNRHLNGLIAKSKKSEIGISYLQGRYGEADLITSIAMMHYTRKSKKNSYTGRLFFAGRDGYDSDNQDNPMPGGSSLQFQGEWTHVFNNRWETTLSGAVGGRYFPTTMLYAKLQRNFKKDFTLDLHCGFRIIPMYQKSFEWSIDKLNEETNTMGIWEFTEWEKKKYSLLNLGLGFSKSVESLLLNGKFDAYQLSSQLYFSTQMQAKYFFLDDAHSSLLAFAAVGTAPEASIIDYAMPSSFEKISTTVGCGVNYLVSPSLGIGIIGILNTFYDKKVAYREGSENSFTDYYKTSYKNLYNLEINAIVFF